MQDQCAVDFNYLESIGLDKPPDGVVSMQMNDFVGTEWVVDWLDDLWCKNYEINKQFKIKRFEKTWIGCGKAVVLVGASPSVLKQIETLKSLDDNFIIVACNSIYAKLLQEGVRVDYIFAVEGRDHIASDFTVQDDHAELIVCPFTSPEAIKKWKGKISLYYLGGGRKYKSILEQDGIKEIEIGGGNSISTALCWAYKYLKASDFIFTGVSFCYYDDYYFDKRSTEYVCQFNERDKKIKAVDIYGNLVNVTPSQLSYKTWLESFMRYVKDVNYINATEDGILGVVPKILSVEGENVQYTIQYLPWINIIPFAMSVKAYNQKFKRR
jgi:hypothetical protein